MNEHGNQRETVRIEPVRVEATHAALAAEGKPPRAGEALPLFWHWTQFWTIERPSSLGRDGHPKVGGFIPDLGLPRRMWAGGSLQFISPLIVGETAERVSQVIDIKKKEGRSGPLAFVTVEHVISMGDRLCIKERQDLVYRKDPDPGAPQPNAITAPGDETARTSHSVTTTDLFRYSALTFNGHRIHYDLEYARDVEGYPGLVTHGPLLAQRLIELAKRELGQLHRFDFRAVSPLFHFEAFDVCSKPAKDGLEMWVKGPNGRLAMTASAG